MVTSALQASGIDRPGRPIPHVPIQIRIARTETDWIFADYPQPSATPLRRSCFMDGNR